MLVADLKFKICNAPKGSTHIDRLGIYYSRIRAERGYTIWLKYSKCNKSFILLTCVCNRELQSLSDLKEILALRERVAELEKVNEN